MADLAAGPGDGGEGGFDGGAGGGEVRGGGGQVQHAAAVGQPLAVLLAGAGMDDCDGCAANADGHTLLGARRVVLGGQHHGDGGVGLELEVAGHQAALGHLQQQLGQVLVQQLHHDLGLGVAEPHVVLQQLRAPGRPHDAQEQHAPGHQPIGLQAPQGGLHQPGAHELDVLRPQEGQRAEGAHAAGVGALVAVEDALVVLAGGQQGVGRVVRVHVRQHVQG